MTAVPPGRHLIADLYLAIVGAGSALTGPDAVHATLTASRRAATVGA